VLLLLLPELRCIFFALIVVTTQQCNVTLEMMNIIQCVMCVCVLGFVLFLLRPGGTIKLSCSHARRQAPPYRTAT
jgi:hypothetical protein